MIRLSNLLKIEGWLNFDLSNDDDYDFHNLTFSPISSLSQQFFQIFKFVILQSNLEDKSLVMSSVRHEMFCFQRVFPLFLRFQNTDLAMGIRRYVLLYCCIIECLVSETSGGNEVSKINITHGTKQSRKRRFLVYPDNGSFAEVSDSSRNIAVSEMPAMYGTSETPIVCCSIQLMK
jgi:hypothetical protein